jgi:transposase-like protein
MNLEKELTIIHLSKEINLITHIDNLMKSLEVNTMKCCGCQSRWVIKKGFIPTRRGRLQRFMCNDCGRTFYRSIDYKGKIFTIGGDNR